MPPLTFRPGATRQGASAVTANVCIMQMTSCPHKQVGANQCHTPLPSANQCRSLSCRSGCNRRGRRSSGGRRGQKKKKYLTLTHSTSAIIYGWLITLPEVKHAYVSYISRKGNISGGEGWLKKKHCCCLLSSKEHLVSAAAAIGQTSNSNPNPLTDEHWKAPIRSTFKVICTWTDWP